MDYELIFWAAFAIIGLIATVIFAYLGKKEDENYVEVRGEWT